MAPEVVIPPDGMRPGSRGPIPKPFAERFWAKIDKSPGWGPNGNCWLWIGNTNGGGYGRILTAETVVVPSHRASWVLHNGPIPPGLYVCHRCDMRPCVRPDHLFLGTAKDNSQDSVVKGRSRQGPVDGENNPRAKLTERDVLAARHRAANGERIRTLAADFGVTCSAMRDVVAGSHWPNVGGPRTLLGKVRGERQGSSILTEGDVHTIRQMSAAGYAQAYIGSAVGISQTQVWKIVHRIQWRHVD